MMVQTRRYFYCVFLMLFVALGLQAQELTVKSLEVAPMDLSASTQPRNDLNGNACALVKVQLAMPDASFEGNVIGDAEFRKGEYWVYMSAGSYMLNIKHGSFVPLFVNFRDYDIKKVEGKTTYVLTLLLPQMMNVPVDDGMRYLVIAVEPGNATVMVDGKQQEVKNGTAKVRLSQGSHSYSVSAVGFATKQGTVDVGREKKELTVKLESAMALLTVTCPTEGSSIYINEELRGRSPWKGSLVGGDYLVEARKVGYRHSQKSIRLGENDQQTITLPALQAITGSIDVNYDPVGTEVWLDGKRLGTSPDIFRNIVIGTHEVELRKDGCTTEKKQVIISENQTASFTGSLTTMQTMAAATPVNTDGSVIVSSSGADIETFTVNGVSFNMVRVEGGTFQMGSNDRDAFPSEKPVHQVTLFTYLIGETEVTQALWKAVMGSNPSIYKGDNLPVDNVSWNDCQTFLQKLSQKTGKSFRLPTEAEWEYAARGGQKSQGYEYSGNNNLDEVAWYGMNSGDSRLGDEWNMGKKDSGEYIKKIESNGCRTHPVKEKHANELGLYDMSGNVWEYCEDWWTNDYSSSLQTNPQGPSNGTFRVHRGGSFRCVGKVCRSTRRYSISPSYRSDDDGLRLAL